MSMSIQFQYERLGISLQKILGACLKSNIEYLNIAKRDFGNDIKSELMTIISNITTIQTQIENNIAHFEYIKSVRSVTQIYFGARAFENLLERDLLPLITKACALEEKFANQINLEIEFMSS